MAGPEDARAMDSDRLAGVLSDSVRPASASNAVDTDIDADIVIDTTAASAADDPDAMEVEEAEAEAESLEGMDVELDDVPESADDDGDLRHTQEAMDMINGEEGAGDGKRVKVYELRDQSWFDRGTGHCKGVYDDAHNRAMVIVEPEIEGEDVDAPGGFLTHEPLLTHVVVRGDLYQRQQDTLIVWTEPTTQLDIALSFQDPEGCRVIWEFIMQVQVVLEKMARDEPGHETSPTTSTSPLMSTLKEPWEPPTLANIKDQDLALRMHVKSQAGRDRALEHILSDNYIKQLIGVLHQAEDLESLEDLHALCSLMQTILMFNENAIFEYILADDIFLGVLGILEYDPEFPTLKASYRDFFQTHSRFRTVVDIRDEAIRHKIHQTARLIYLKETVLARVLDDPTFGILNSYVFFNQVDIIAYVTNAKDVMEDLFRDFKPVPAPAAGAAAENVDKKKDVVLFIHQLMGMAKSVQVGTRLALYRALVERGLALVCEWAFGRAEATVRHAGAEMLTLAVEHDAPGVRTHVLREHDAGRRTLVVEITTLMQSTKDLGLVSQLAESMRTLLDSGDTPDPRAILLMKKDQPPADLFIAHFYEACADAFVKPVLELPHVQTVTSRLEAFSPDRAALLSALADLLAYCMVSHNDNAKRWFLATTVQPRLASLLYAREKTLRHAALRFFKSCIRGTTHLVWRNYSKWNLFTHLIDLVLRETERDTMLSSACVDLLDMLRRENMKLIIMDIYQKCPDKMDALVRRPYVRTYVAALAAKYEQYKEPAPGPSREAQERPGWRDAVGDDDDWFNTSDTEDERAGALASGSASGSAPVTTVSQAAGISTGLKRVGDVKIPVKRKRQILQSPNRRASPKAGAKAGGVAAVAANEAAATTTATASPGASASAGPRALVDYDDASEDEDEASPRRPTTALGDRDDRAALAAAEAASPVRPAAGSASGSPAASRLLSTGSPGGAGALKGKDELEDDLGALEARVRAKRARDADDDDGFIGILGKKEIKEAKGGTTTAAGKEPEEVRIEVKVSGVEGQGVAPIKETRGGDAQDEEDGGEETREAGEGGEARLAGGKGKPAAKDKDKKIRLSLGGLGKKMMGK
ncbi:Platinum sensitivity protein [Cryptotrichosporon argae]